MARLFDYDYKMIALLADQGLSRVAVSEAIGCSNGTVTRALGNTRPPRIENGIRVCVLCGKSIASPFRFCSPYHRNLYWRCYTDKGKAWVRERALRLGSNSAWRFYRLYLIFVEEKPCAICGEVCKSLLECDHVWPRAAGGVDSLDNLQVLCIDCHRMKSILDTMLMRPFQGTLTVGAVSSLT